MRQQLGLQPDHIAVGTIARLFRLKGHEDLLQAAPQLCQQFPNLRFLWIGDGILRPQFEQQISAMNLRDRFILTGLVPPTRIPELVNAMDILAHPTRREGLARALAQGGLAALPVVTYDIDGNREGLIPNQTGQLIPPFNTTQFQRAIADLAANPQKRQTLGLAGREFAQRRFSAQVMVEALEKVYEAALAR
jgi:glycosyltransferase involved in cell wall biosynthesis